MRSLSVVVAILMAADGVTQTPLSIDPSFQFYLNPQWPGQWDNSSGPTVGGLAIRENGDLLVNGIQVLSPVVVGGIGCTVMIDPQGGYIDRFSDGIGEIVELSNGQYFYNYKRINNDGTTDLSFGHPNTAYEAYIDWHVYADRSVLLAGLFSMSDDDPLDICLIKVDEWGEIDTSFTMRRGQVDKPASHIHSLSNGQFLLNGTWNEYEGYQCGTLVRINADGSPDTSFFFPAYKGSLRSIHEQPDGKIIMAGQFWMNNMVDTLKLVRVNTDGSLDQSFNNYGDYRTTDHPLGGMLGGPYVIEPLDEDRFFVGGKYTMINGEPRSCIACVDTLGNLLDCWAGGGLMPVSITESGYPYMSAHGFKCFDNGDCYIYGKFRGFIDENGVHPDQKMLVRVHGPKVGVTEHETDELQLIAWPNPGSEELHLAWKNDEARSVQIKITDALGRIHFNQTLQDARLSIRTEHLPVGGYAISVISPEMSGTIKWMKQ